MKKTNDIVKIIGRTRWSFDRRPKKSKSNAIYINYNCGSDEFDASERQKADSTDERESRGDERRSRGVGDSHFRPHQRARVYRKCVKSR